MYRLVAFLLCTMCIGAQASAVPEVPQRRVMNGVAMVKPVEFMASIRANGNPHCGASLITPEHILTAGHCVRDLPPATVLTVWIGGSNIHGGDDWEVRNIRTIICHPSYDPETLVNDICVLVIDRPSTRKPVRLNLALSHDSESEQGIVGAGAKAVLLGFGAMMAEGEPNSVSLRKADVEVLDPEICAVHFGPVFARDSSICSYNSCRGDSGGPLMSADMQVQIGVVSYGTERASGDLCGALDEPSVYVNIAEQTRFITLATLGSSNYVATQYASGSGSTVGMSQTMFIVIVACAAVGAAIVSALVVLACVMCRRRYGTKRVSSLGSDNYYRNKNAVSPSLYSANYNDSTISGISGMVFTTDNIPCVYNGGIKKPSAATKSQKARRSFDNISVGSVQCTGQSVSNDDLHAIQAQQIAMLLTPQRPSSGRHLIRPLPQTAESAMDEAQEV